MSLFLQSEKNEVILVSLYTLDFISAKCKILYQFLLFPQSTKNLTVFSLFLYTYLCSHFHNVEKLNWFYFYFIYCSYFGNLFYFQKMVDLYRDLKVNGCQSNLHINLKLLFFYKLYDFFCRLHSLINRPCYSNLF